MNTEHDRLFPPSELVGACRRRGMKFKIDIAALNEFDRRNAKYETFHIQAVLVFFDSIKAKHLSREKLVSRHHVDPEELDLLEAPPAEWAEEVVFKASFPVPTGLPQY